MIWLFGFAGLFLILLLFPILHGIHWYYNSKNKVLIVRQNRTRDPRYFSKSFDRLFRAAWEKKENGTLQLSKQEHYQIADEMPASDYPEEVAEILVAEKKDFMPPEKIRFLNEIFSFQNAQIPPETHLRSIRSEKNMVLGKKTRLDRWADAEGTLAIYDNCRLGISVSSPQELSIGRNCSFKRIYSPIIHAGAYPWENEEPRYPRSEKIYYLGETTARRTKSGHIGPSDAPDGIANASFLAKDKLIVEEDIIVQGSIRAHKGIRLAERAVVCGNLFSDGDIYLSQNSTVLGSIFTQSSVYLEAGCVVGQKDQIRSIIARDRIEIGRDCFIYGYVSAEGGGVVWKDTGAEETPQICEETYLTRCASAETPVLEDQEPFDGCSLLADKGGAHICD